MLEKSPVTVMLPYAAQAAKVRPLNNARTWFGCPGSLLGLLIPIAMWASIWKDIGHGQVGVSAGPVVYLVPIIPLVLSVVGWWRGARFGGIFGVTVSSASLAGIILIQIRMW